ncbi:MAG TPA: histidinol-phosphate transaminase [Candidatus Angelobacter sp.]|nr:histidinol-phosphate transaminase [Candidatus Angelobacter sp.]
MNILDLIPPHLRKVGAYVPGKPIRQAQRESGLAMIKMASNENPLGPSPLALQAMRDRAAEVNFYPDTDATDLRLALAARHTLAPEQVLVADGSTPLLHMLAHILLRPGLSCISSERSFIIYPIAVGASGGKYVTIPTKNDGYDLDAIAAAIHDNTRLVILANPNNPTGTMFDADATEAFLRRVPEHVLVVLDEAYSDFAQYFADLQRMSWSRSFDYVRSGRMNVVVLRTFSKAYGLAGVRLGYACGHPEVLRYLARVRSSFSISALAEAAGLAAIRDEEHVRRTLENNAAGAAWLMERFTELGMRAIPTSANFIYFETSENADVVSARIQDEGVIVRSLVPWGIDNAIRVTIGTPEQNERFFQALKKAGAKDKISARSKLTPVTK